MGRLSPGTMTVAFAAILVGLGGAFVVRQHLHKPELPPMPELKVDNSLVVPVALTDLEAGRSLSINDVALIRLTPEQFAKSPYAHQPYLRVSEQIAKRTLKVSLKQGDAFLPQNLYPEGMGPDLAERLQAGYRAVTVPIANVGAVQGFARSGSIVDVLFRVSPKEAAEDRPQETMTLLERVEVLAIDTYTQPGQQVELDQDGTVTLAVTPHQAKMLKVVEGRGELSLTLRNPEDQFEFVPFDLGTEEGVSQADSQYGAMPVSFLADRTGRADIDRDDVRVVGDLDRAVGHASERITLDDLLGWAPKPKKVQMEVYFGANREIREFEEFNTQRIDVLRQGGRIRTPIAGIPAVPSDSTAQVDRTLHQFATSGAAGQ